MRRWGVIVLICVALICAGIVVRSQLRNWRLVKQAAAYRVRAEQGDAESQLWLASMYYYGKGLRQDFVEASRWYRKAAEQGNPKAEYSLGDLYREGKGVAKDYQEAARWCRKAAEQGDAMAQDALGYIYYRGEGVPQDLDEAARWYRKSAAQGFPQAEYELGYMYYYGYGVPQDKTESGRLFRQAAAQGNENAKKALGTSKVRAPEISKLGFALKCVSALYFSVVFLRPGQGRQSRVQAVTGVTALLVLAAVSLDLFWYFRVGSFQSTQALTVLYSARHLVDGAVIAMLVFVVYPKSAKGLLMTAAALLIAFIVFEAVYAELWHVPFKVFILCFVGWPIGMSVPAAIFLWLDRNAPDKW